MSAAAQGNEMYTSQAARDTAHSLKNLTNAIRTVAATSDTPEVQRKILYSGQEVLAHSSKLVNEAQRSLQTVGKFYKFIHIIFNLYYSILFEQDLLLVSTKLLKISLLP